MKLFAVYSETTNGFLEFVNNAGEMVFTGMNYKNTNYLQIKRPRMIFHTLFVSNFFPAQNFVFFFLHKIQKDSLGTIKEHLITVKRILQEK